MTYVPASAVAVLAGLAAGTPLAAAEPPDTSSWVCQYCPFATGHRADVTAGASYVSDDSAWFGDASGYDQQGAYLDVQGNGSSVFDSRELEWQIEDVALDARHLAVAGGRPGRYELSLDYRELPRHVFDTSETVFVEIPGDGLALPAGWVRAPTTGGFTALENTLVERDIASERNTLAFGAEYFPHPHWRLSADYRRRERDGLRSVGGPSFTQSSLLPAPFDYATDEAEAGLRYSLARGWVELSYFGSFFQNTHPGLAWETPFTSAPGSETGVQARPPDNAFQQLALAGARRFDVYDTVVAFNVAGGRAEQEDVLLPYASNPLLAQAPLPRQRLDGRIDTTEAALTLSARPLAKGRVSLSWRLDDKDNRTPVETWTRIIVDTFNSGDPEQNVPYSYRRNTLEAEARYDLSRSLTLGGGVERLDTDRDHQAVASQTEDSGWALLEWRPNSLFEIRTRGGTAERDIGEYDENLAAAAGQNPLLRKYNLAYRYRRFGELDVSGALPETPVLLSLDVTYAEDEYTKSLLGLTEGDDLRIAGDLSFTLNERRYFYVHGGYERIDSEQRGSESFGLPDWSAGISDRFVSAGAGMRFRQIADNMDFTLDYTYAAGRTEIATHSSSGGFSTFPDLVTDMSSLCLELDWTRSARLSIGAHLRWDTIDMDDWALDGVAPDTVPVLLSLGAEPWDYDLLFFGIGFTWRVGGEEETASGGEDR
ncbi:MAG TPA: MtrB/PioB family decaheme-associated outer membrane protein [Woeseiaceae bacterium]